MEVTDQAARGREATDRKGIAVEGKELDVQPFEDEQEAHVREDIQCPDIGRPIGVNQTSAKGKETREDLQKMIWTEEEGSAVDREGQSQRVLCLRVARGGGESEGKECEEESSDSDGNECCETKKKATGTGERSDGQEATVVDQKIESEDKSERSKEMFEKDKHREGDREEEILPLGRLVRSERRDRERETERQRETERERQRERETERERREGIYSFGEV
jgi:hypothetical protein